MTGWAVPVGSRCTSEKKTRRMTGMPDGEQQRLAPPQGHAHLGRALGRRSRRSAGRTVAGHRRVRPSSAPGSAPAGVPASTARASSPVRRRRRLPAGDAQVDLLERAPPGPQLGEGKVAVLHPPRQERPAGWRWPRRPRGTAPGRSSVTVPASAAQGGAERGHVEAGRALEADAALARRPRPARPRCPGPRRGPAP